MRNKIYLIITTLLLLATTSFSQNVGINATGAAPATSAGLDVSFTNKGVLVPRVALTATNNTSPVTSPTTSLLIYNTATAGSGSTAVSPGYYFWNGSIWVKFLDATSGDDWHIDGNSGTTAGTNFLGTTDNISLVFKTNNSERMRILNTGYVGIGTTSPNELLELNGNIRGNQSGALRISTGSGYVDVGPKNTSWAHFYTDRPRYWFSTGITVETGNIGSYNENLSLQTSGTTRITALNSNGNVGIGVTNPAYSLEVGGTFGYGDGSAGSYRSRTETRNDAGQIASQSGFFQTSAPAPAADWPTGASSWWHLLDIRHSNNANNYAMQFAGSFFDQKLYFRKTNNNAAAPWYEVLTTASLNDLAWSLTGNSGTTAGTNFLGTTDNVSLVFKTNNTERMRILNTGRVGIGTSAPSSDLEVNGRIESSRLGYVGSYNSSEVQGIWSIGSGWGISTGSNDFGTQYGMVYAHTNAGTGTSKKPISGWGHQILFTTNGTRMAAISLSNGNGYFAGSVGIGTTAPAAKLHVNGSFRLTNGTQANGRVLTSDANGTATWQSLSTNTYGTNNQGVTGTTDISVNTTTFTDMSQMTITFTPVHSVVYVNFTMAGYESVTSWAQQYVDFRILRNGTVVGGANCTAGDADYADLVTSFNGALNLAVPVTAGASTTIKVQWRRDGVYTNTIYCTPASTPDYSHRSLIIID